MFCPNCGKQIPDGSVFCSQCGAATGANYTTQNASDPSSAVSTLPLHKSNASTEASGTKSVVVLGMTLPPEWADAEQSVQEAGKEKVAAPYVDNPANQEMTACILGNEREYYQKQFQMIQTNGNCNINWFSFLFGISHAAYKGVWKEWLMAMKYPLVGYYGTKLLASLAWRADIGVGVALETILSIIFGIWLLIWWIRTALRFNRIYRLHIDAKLRKGDVTPDDNWNQVLIITLAAIVVSSVISLIYTSAVESSMMSAFDF